MIRSFRNQGTEDIFNGFETSIARRTCPVQLWRVARRKLDQINRVQNVKELALPPGNRLECLKGSGSGQYSIRINDQFRICFNWEAEFADEVEITDYH